MFKIINIYKLCLSLIIVIIKIKEKPEDFIVEEKIDLRIISDGKYCILKVTKKNLNTLDVVKILENKFNVLRKNISFAGSKDKRAITTQYFSVFGLDKNRICNFKNVDVEFAGYSDRPISLGSLTGNRFSIKVDKKIDFRIKWMVNYFGEQRFSKNNAEIGKSIIKKDFKKACELIDNFLAKKHLQERKNDFIGAIKRLDKRLISLYINAYQSYLWNKAVCLYLKEKCKDYREHEGLVFPRKLMKNLKMPLISFDTEFEDKLVERIYSLILDSEGICLRDFLIRQFPEQLPVHTERDVFVKVKNFKFFNSRIEFELPKGSYATVLIKQIESFEH